MMILNFGFFSRSFPHHTSLQQHSAYIGYTLTSIPQLVFDEEMYTLCLRLEVLQNPWASSELQFSSCAHRQKKRKTINFISLMLRTTRNKYLYGYVQILFHSLTRWFIIFNNYIILTMAMRMFLGRLLLHTASSDCWTNASPIVRLIRHKFDFISRFYYA